MQDHIKLIPKDFDDLEEWKREIARIHQGGKSIEYDPEQIYEGSNQPRLTGHPGGKTEQIKRGFYRG